MLTDEHQIANATLSMSARLNLASEGSCTCEEEQRYCLEISRCIAAIIIISTT